VSLGLEITEAPGAAEEAAIREALRSANQAATGLPRDVRPLAIVLRDADGAVIGGLWGRTAWRWLYIENLVVPPALRGQGLGARMLAMAEAEAIRRGCVGARLDTYSFQARPFYERQGYVVAGSIPDCPPGHIRYTMYRRLDGAKGVG
jgi:GNAT superfamily N-acetyltransferase